jgi:hypothetical protein
MTFRQALLAVLTPTFLASPAGPEAMP